MVGDPRHRCQRLLEVFRFVDSAAFGLQLAAASWQVAFAQTRSNTRTQLLFNCFHDCLKNV
jgi:hypothetical protein